MVLNYEQIKNKKLIQNYEDNSFDNASYDLRIDKLITVSGSVKNKLAIAPNSMAVAISKEIVKLPKNIIGHAFVKTRLSQEGIMANNIGIIDPGYEGPLSSVLVNFGKNSYELKENEVFLRITFSEFQTPSENIELDYGLFGRKEYHVNKRTSTIEFLGNAFVDIEENIKKKVTSSITKMIGNFGLWATAFALLIAGIGLILNYTNNDSNKIENLQEQINLFNSNQLLLLSNQEVYKNQIDSLNKTIDQLNPKDKTRKDDNN